MCISEQRTNNDKAWNDSSAASLLYSVGSLYCILLSISSEVGEAVVQTCDRDNAGLGLCLNDFFLS